MNNIAKRDVFRRSSGIVVVMCLVFLSFSCREKKSEITIIPSDSGLTAEIRQCVFKSGESVSVELSDNAGQYTIQLKNLSEKELPVLKEVSNKLTWEIDIPAPNCAVGVYVGKGKEEPAYVTCFRVVNDSSLTTYKIRKDEFEGLGVYKLDGGMSAEYAVQKSLSSLTGNVSHTWEIGPGGGPSPVWGTPDFLEKSLQYTVDLYDKELGKGTPVETVIIATGVPSIPYLSAALKAPVLPLHFLASVNTCKEIQSILDYSRSEGYKTYATLGYDASMSGVGVAWVKILELPEEYLRFIADHQVKNVLIVGVGEKVYAESYARRVNNHSAEEEYSDGSFYLQYTNHGSPEDMLALTTNILDYESQELGPVHMIADWESGILDKQIETFGRQLKQIKKDCYVLTSREDMLSMYDLAGELALAYSKKNASSSAAPVQGVVFNEYLISEPMYEFVTGYIPLLYWQFTPAPITVSRMDKRLAEEIKKKFPETETNRLAIHLNARIGKKELADVLTTKGYADITMRNDGIEEVWDLSDGLNAPCELAAHKIVNEIGLESYRNKIKEHTPLTISDFSEMELHVKGIYFIQF